MKPLLPYGVVKTLSMYFQNLSLLSCVCAPLIRLDSTDAGARREHAEPTSSWWEPRVHVTYWSLVEGLATPCPSLLQGTTSSALQAGDGGCGGRGLAVQVSHEHTRSFSVQLLCHRGVREKHLFPQERVWPAESLPSPCSGHDSLHQSTFANTIPPSWSHRDSRRSVSAGPLLLSQCLINVVPFILLYYCSKLWGKTRDFTM